MRKIENRKKIKEKNNQFVAKQTCHLRLKKCSTSTIYKFYTVT